MHAHARARERQRDKSGWSGVGVGVRGWGLELLLTSAPVQLVHDHVTTDEDLAGTWRPQPHIHLAIVAHVQHIRRQLLTHHHIVPGTRGSGGAGEEEEGEGAIRIRRMPKRTAKRGGAGGYLADMLCRVWHGTVWHSTAWHRTGASNEVMKCLRNKLE